MANWTDHVVGDRMTVDQDFSSRVQESPFTSQEWGLIMTATEFEMDDPGTDQARIVANTEKLPQMMPELEKVRTQMPGPGGPGTGRSGGGPGTGAGGFLSSVKSALGLGTGDGVDQQRLEDAERLTQEYAERLQSHLETRGKWERIQEVAARASTRDGSDTESEPGQ